MDPLDRALSELPTYDAPEWTIQEILQQVEQDRAAEAITADAPTADDAGKGRNARRQLAGWIGLAAGIVLGLGLLWTSSEESQVSAPVPHPGMTLKGASSGTLDPSISLGLSLLREDVPVALVPGASARASDTVLLRYTTDSSGFAYLFRLGPDDTLEVFHGTPTLPGTHHVTVDDRIVGYELDGLSGEHMFGVAFSREPWAPADSEAAAAPDGLARAIAGRGVFPRSYGDVTMDALPVRLESSNR